MQSIARHLSLALLLFAATEAIFLRDGLAHSCSAGEYWCQDRCGSDAYGDTCCLTPNGQHNLCGAGTICCMYGCCPSGTVCNAVGGCDASGPPGLSSAVGTTIQPPSTITSQTTVYETHTDTIYVTLTQLETCRSLFTTSSQQLSTKSRSSLSLNGTGITGNGTASRPPVSSTGGSSTPPGSGILTTTAPDGKTIISSSGVIIIGNDTFTVPTSLTAPTTITTDGETFTFSPTPSDVLTITEPDGKTVISSSGLIIIGSDTLTVPTGLTAPTTITTDGETFTFSPTATSAITTTTPSGVLTITEPDGKTVISSSGLIIIGSDTLTVPTSLTAPTTITTDGETFTFSPTATSAITTTTPSGVLTITEPDGQIVISSSGVIIIGSDTFTVPTGLTTPTTITTDGETFTFGPPPVGSATSAPSTTSSTTVGAFLFPVSTQVDQPEPTKGGSIVPCDEWFFAVCIAGILGGFIWTFPPGTVIPPGPPPGIEFPPGWFIDGVLPPWPKITIGPDQVPIIPPPPEGDECVTKTASLCTKTTSFGVTVSSSTTKTTATSTGTSCARIQGCDVTAKTVTTKTASTASCTATPTDSGSRRMAARQDGGGGSCPVTFVYAVMPSNPTDSATNALIAANLLTFVNGDPTKIKTSNSKSAGINYWQLRMTVDQATDFRNFQGVATVFQPCSEGTCPDPSTADPPYSFQLDDSGLQQQLVFVSQDNEPGHILQFYLGKYYFDPSAGRDIPVYIVDTGADLSNSEFTAGDNLASKARWINIGVDYDGRQPQDDSQVPAAGTQGPGLGHGTAMLSLVGGATVGVAKQIKPIIVRMPRRRPEGGGANALDYLDGVSAVNDDVQSTGSSVTQAILLMAFFLDRTIYLTSTDGVDFADPFVKQFNTHLNQLINKRVLPVTGSGNQAKRSNVAGWPAAFGFVAMEQFPTTFLPELVVAGAVDVNGALWIGTNQDSRGGGIPHVYAPGRDVWVAAARASTEDPRRPGLRQGTGTSDAAAMTVGLAAYLLRLGQIRQSRVKLPAGTQQLDLSPQGLKDLLVGNAFVRGTNTGLSAIWNGYTINTDLPQFGTCPYQPGNVLRRRQSPASSSAGGGCTPPATSTAPPTSTPASSTSPPSSTPPPPPPTPTGGFWLGAVLGNVPTVVGDKNTSCAWVNFDNDAHNVGQYQVDVFDSNNKEGDANTYLDGTKPFTIKKLAFGNPVCFFSGLELSFTPDSSDGTFIIWNDNGSPTTSGFCAKVANPTPDNCQTGNFKLTSEVFWHCEAQDNPSYCNI
ncbi:hypothetical protein GQ53DRAFT_823579 [Thozetella sp. PMI_491]|nr:hypothetical protein GQ53DRAFT_823579 [Thozetella sp. PMI_491]